MSSQNSLRADLVTLGAALYDRGLTPGRTGNLSVRSGDGLIITPTDSCLGRLDPERLSQISFEGSLISGDRPSKELVLHQALYRRHPECNAVAHLHSNHAVAVSCLPDLDREDALPPITPYYVMRVGRLPLVDYGHPGSAALEEGVRRAAERSRCMLLRNHGSLAAATTLAGAVDAVEEIEETARLYLMIAERSPEYLTPAAVAELRARYWMDP
jgi:ribulose-5-phosphate 4-epimerase/fuculose-1-phosphate aldolase